MNVHGSRLVRLCRALILVLLLGTLPALPASAWQPAQTAPAQGAPAMGTGFVPGEVLIGWQGGAAPVPPAATSPAPGRRELLAHGSAEWQAAATALAAATARPVLDVQPAYGFARLAVPQGQERAELARLAALPWVRYAQPNYLVWPAGTPNDPYYPSQWNLIRVAAPQAWDIASGANSVIVAVLDTGVDFTHPDLAGRLLTDGTNYIAPGTLPQDDDGHGTHVAGIMAALTNNGIGVAGLASSIQVLPYKVMRYDANSGGSVGSTADLATAVYAATDYVDRSGLGRSVRVINISLGSPEISSGDNSLLHNAVTYARQHGVLVVAAAGNYGSALNNPPNPLFYPAAYPEAFAVAATDFFDSHPDYSGHQPYVALAAPGGTGTSGIVSTYWPGSYATLSGTSMAAPMVSGAAALLWSLYPAMSVDDVIFALQHTADKVSGIAYPYTNGRNDYFGAGRLNVWAAVRPLRASTEQVSLTKACVEQLATDVVLTNALDQTATYAVSTVPAQSWLTVSPSSGTLAPGATAFLHIAANANLLATGSYNGLVRVSLTSAPFTTLDIHTHVGVLSNAAYCSYMSVVGG